MLTKKITSLNSYRGNISKGTDTMEQERIIYSLNIEDVQTVASEILDRHLSTNEIAQIEDAVAERIDWFEAIASAISENVGES